MDLVDGEPPAGAAVGIEDQLDVLGVAVEVVEGVDARVPPGGERLGGGIVDGAGAELHHPEGS